MIVWVGIIEHWAVNDHLAMLLQLGAIPDPALNTRIR
jgi:hypothetical protein